MAAGSSFSDARVAISKSVPGGGGAAPARGHDKFESPKASRRSHGGMLSGVAKGSRNVGLWTRFSRSTLPHSDMEAHNIICTFSKEGTVVFVGLPLRFHVSLGRCRMWGYSSPSQVFRADTYESFAKDPP